MCNTCCTLEFVVEQLACSRALDSLVQMDPGGLVMLFIFVAFIMGHMISLSERSPLEAFTAFTGLSLTDAGTLLVAALAGYWFVLRHAREAMHHSFARQNKPDEDEEYFQRLQKRDGAAGFEADMSAFSGAEDGYRWTQTDDELEVVVPVPPSTRAKDVCCTVMPRSLSIALAGADIVKVPPTTRMRA